MKDTNFLKQRIAYWLSLSMLPSAAIFAICMLLFLKPEPTRVYEMPVILVECDGASTVLWNGGDHANIRALIEKNSAEIANALFANPREVSMTSAKIQSASGFFLPKSVGERQYLSLGREALEGAKSVETTFKFDGMTPDPAQAGARCAFRPRFADVTYDAKAKDWSAVVKGVQVTTLENGTQASRRVTMELLARPSEGKKRNDQGQAVLIYNMRVSYEK
ncbi:MAG: hypothetical protein M3Q07_06035 [Pseudobdellovibrionaceae bacterium]|nr:hypothetical protein [Pseudobdellovibrionaceae bacterium]